MTLELSHLPAGVIIDIFCLLPNFTDAFNLAATCNRFREIFAERKLLILKYIAAYPGLSLASRQLVRAQALASSFGDSNDALGYHNLLYEFIASEVHDGCRSPTDSPYGKPIVPSEVPGLEADWHVVSALEPAILTQVQSAKPFLERFGIWKDHYRVPERVNSGDRTRIHRALYRMWTYQVLFYHNAYRPILRYALQVVDPTGQLQWVPMVAQNRRPGPAPDIRYLKSTIFTSDGIELHELLLLWSSIIYNRLFTIDHFSLAIKVAMGEVILVDAQGQPVVEARGRIFQIDAPSNDYIPRLCKFPPQGIVPEPEIVSGSPEKIAVIAFLNQWHVSKWTMAQHEKRISAFLKGLIRIITPKDMLLFLNPSPPPHAPVAFEKLGELADKVREKFDNWGDPATGRGTMSKSLNRWFKFPVYEEWGSFLFGLKGTKGAFHWDMRAAGGGASDLVWRVDLKRIIAGVNGEDEEEDEDDGEGEWVVESEDWKGWRMELSRIERERYYVL